MITSFLALLSALMDQVSSSVVKISENKKKYPITVWESAFISLMSSSIFVVIGFFRLQPTEFKLTLPNVLLLRIALEVINAYATYKALKMAQLSSYYFMRVFSVVVALISEMFLLGTLLPPIKYLGILIITLSIAFAFRKGIKSTAGLFPLFVSSFFGGFLNSLAKYQYTFDNLYKVELAARIGIAIILFLIILHTHTKKMKTLSQTTKSNLKIWLLIPLRSLTTLSSINALNFGSAAIYVAVERGGSVLFGVFSGHQIFKEKAFGEKFLLAITIIIGLFIVTFGK